MQKGILTIIFLCICTLSFATGDEILGVWQNGTGKGHIQIYKCHGKYFGKIIWLKNPVNEAGEPKLDKKNQNKDLQVRPLLGSEMLRDFVYENNEWSGGKIYNPQDGNEYKAYLTLVDNETLAVRGFLGISWFGKTDTWKKVH